MIRYSFIIPHYNSPSLLNRLLNTIPDRDDIEIIVVDDNSPEIGKPIIYDKRVILKSLNPTQSNGAGHARNVGLELASGQWILFADADDFYEKGFINELDKYCNDVNIDIVYFNVRGVDSDTLKPSVCADRVRNLIVNSDKSPSSKEELLFRHFVPWCKMIRRDYIERHYLRFDEVRKNNDVMFSCLASYFTNRILIIKTSLYVYTYNSKGITHSLRSIEGSIDVLRNKMKIKEFYNYIGHPEWKIKPSFFTIVMSVLLHQGLLSFCKFTYITIFQSKKLFSDRFRYIEELTKTAQIVKELP